MVIISINARKMELEMGLSSWTRDGYIIRKLTFADESDGQGEFDHHFGFVIKQLADFETVEAEVNNSLEVFDVFSGSVPDRAPFGGRFIGKARVMNVSFRDGRRSKKYAWSDVFFRQAIFESIEQSLRGYCRHSIEIEGMKFDESETEDHEKVMYEERFVITNVSFGCQ